ncbi:MAG TPA: NAD(P)/FAD-dependent oxidoreductase, partial [Anaerolineae bacterium]|nr:NAD(P)/FAD-dependent oxidoreductase [Anaerolineae bacterium]
MNEARTFDAIVIGAGPAGSTAAREIALAGWRVALVERDEFPGAHNVCGGGLEGADAALLKVPPALIHKTLTRRTHVFPWGVTETAVPHVNLVRREFDRYLARQAVEAGAELFVRTWALAVEVTKSGQVRLQGKDLARGEQVCYRARLAVFADGPHTLAWHALRLGFARRPTSAGVGLVYELAWPDNPLNGYEVHFGAEVASWGYAWVFPKRDELNVGLWCLPSKGEESRHLAERLRRFIAGHPLLRGRRVLRRRGALIPVTPARRI